MKPKATDEDIAIGAWLSAAQDDRMVCQEMKDAINKWFESKEWPTEDKSNQLEIKWEKTAEDRE